jgi:hypothetical protein
VVAVLAYASGGAGAATRTIDRTLVCEMPGEGFPDSTRFMGVAAVSGNRRHRSPPVISASNVFEVRVAVATAPYGRLRTGAVTINQDQCADTSRRVPLSARGLTSARSEARNAYRCDVPATVLMRVRANFERPTGFSRDQRFAPTLSLAKGPITTAYLAVTTVRGRKPLAFGSVNDASGKARLFIASSRCRAER